MSKKLSTAKLTKVVEKHCTSQRSTQRAAGLFLGLYAQEIAPDLLREVLQKFEAYNAPNFTQNMKKDSTYFNGDKEGWSLTAAGKLEATAIFENDAAPTRRRGAPSTKVVTKKVAKKKPLTKKKKKTTASSAAAAVKKPSTAKKAAAVPSKAVAAKRRRARKAAVTTIPVEQQPSVPTEISG